MQFLNVKVLRTIAPITAALAAFGLVSGAVTAASAANSTASSNTSIRSVTSTPAVPTIKIASLPIIKGWPDIKLPVDQYRIADALYNTEVKAVYAYTRECSAKYGVTFDATPPTRKVGAINQDYSRLFGLVDASAAASIGYHTGEVLLADGEASTTGASEDPGEASPNFYPVVTGDPAGAVINGMKVPAGGCISEARSRVGDYAQDRDLAEQAIGYGLSQSDADPRVREAFSSWSACMKAAGYEYSTPTEANNDPRWESSTPSDLEKATAFKDVECKASTNLTALRVAVASAWMVKFVGAHSAQFSAIASHYESQLHQAAAILR